MFLCTDHYFMLHLKVVKRGRHLGWFCTYFSQKPGNFYSLDYRGLRVVVVFGDQWVRPHSCAEVRAVAWLSGWNNGHKRWSNLPSKEKSNASTSKVTKCHVILQPNCLSGESNQMPRHSRKQIVSAGKLIKCLVISADKLSQRRK